YVRAGLLRDLTSVARAGGWAGRLRPGLLDEYNRLLTDVTTAAPARAAAPASPALKDRLEDRTQTPARPSAGVAGVYAVPYDLAAVAVLYNKALFRKLGLPLPHTVAELERAIT